MPINDDAGLEREADAMGARAARGEPVSSGQPMSAPRVAAHGQQSRRPDTVLAYRARQNHTSPTWPIQRKPAVYETFVDTKLTEVGKVAVQESNGAAATVTPADYDSGSRTESPVRPISQAATAVFKQSFIAGHMLNHHLGGPGDEQDNITAITSQQNAFHKNWLENPAKTEVNENKNTIDYCTVITHRADFRKGGKVVAKNLASRLVGGYRVHGGASFGPVEIPLGPTGKNITLENERSTNETCNHLKLSSKRKGESAPAAEKKQSPDRNGKPDKAKDKGGKQEKAGTIKSKIKRNPTLEFTFDRPSKLKDVSVDSPPIEHPGVHVGNVTLDIYTRSEKTNEDGEEQEVLKLDEGSMAVAVDMGGAITSNGNQQQLKIVPDPEAPSSPDVVHSIVQSTGEKDLFGDLTSNLPDFFKDRVTTSADLTDEGMQATLKVSAGDLGPPGLKLQESSISATLGKDGLKLAGNVGISDAAERIKGNLGIGWSNAGLTVTGSATVKDVISGLDPVEAKITYDRAASGLDGLALDIEKVEYKKTIGVIPFKSEAKNLHYDFETGGFSGEAKLTGDLGTLGQVTASAKIANNQLQRADLAYEKTPIELPKQNPIFTGNLKSHLIYENEELSGKIDGTATLKLPALQKLGKSDQPITMSVDAGITGGAVGGSFTLLTPVQLGSHFRVTELGATLSKEGGFGFTGGLELDSGIFQPARVGISYENGKLSGSGEVGIAKGKIVGVDAATITVGIDGDKISGKGTLTPSVQQIQQGNVTFSYSPTDGISFGGGLTLASGIPFLKGTSVDVLVAKRPGAQSYEVSASGALTIELPGFKVNAKASYAKGAFTIEGTTFYKLGLASGDVTIGVTNRALDAQGKPTAQIGDTLLPYGQGSLKLALTPWLQGKAGIKLLPNGEIEIDGGLSIPKPKEFFQKKEFKKELLSIDLDIPILGFTVAGQRVGIFATVGGSVNLDAGVGPGTLKDT
ncbi:MAG TPA: hypothetical protein VNM90_20390, partial [Haliangium sp.]|nr:hypothetical protein [Haliangium sp.]